MTDITPIEIAGVAQSHDCMPAPCIEINSVELVSKFAVLQRKFDSCGSCLVSRTGLERPISNPAEPVSKKSVLHQRLNFLVNSEQLHVSHVFANRRHFQSAVDGHHGRAWKVVTEN